MPQRESREPLGPALARELDPSLPNLAASFTQRIGHRLDHPEGLLSIRVIHEKDPCVCSGPWTPRRSSADRSWLPPTRAGRDGRLSPSRRAATRASTVWDEVAGHRIIRRAARSTTRVGHAHARACPDHRPRSRRATPPRRHIHRARKGLVGHRTGDERRPQLHRRRRMARGETRIPGSPVSMAGLVVRVAGDQSRTAHTARTRNRRRRQRSTRCPTLKSARLRKQRDRGVLRRRALTLAAVIGEPRSSRAARVAADGISAGASLMAAVPA
jgi:hypothetical protein